MIKFGELNAVSKKLLDQVPQLGPKDSAEYRLIGMRPDPENKGKWAIPSIRSIPSRALITDPHTNAIVEIAHVTRIRTRSTKNGPIEEPNIPPIAFTRGQAGRIILQGGNVEDRLMHEYLFLSPYNSSSPCRDDSIQPVYEYLDVKANAKKGIQLMNRKLEAMTFVGNLTPADGLFDYAFMVSRIQTEDPEVARYQLAQFAEADPEKFFKIVESVDSQVKVTYLRAMNAGIIHYDAQTSTVRFVKNQDIICSIPRASTNHEEAFTLWAKASAENMKLVDTLTSLIKRSSGHTTEKKEDTLATVISDDPDQLQTAVRRGRPKKDEV